MRLKPNMEIWLSNSSYFKKLFSAGLLTAGVSEQREGAHWLRGGIGCLLLLCSPSFPTHRKLTLAHSYKNFSNFNGACKGWVQEWLYNLGHRFHQGMCILHTLQGFGHWKYSQKATQSIRLSESFMAKRSVLKVPFFQHSPWDPCISPLLLPFKRRCQVIKLNKACVTKTFSSGDQTSQLHLLPGTTWQHLKLRAKGKGASFRDHQRWLQIGFVFPEKTQACIAGRTEEK